MERRYPTLYLRRGIKWYLVIYYHLHKLQLLFPLYGHFKGCCFPQVAAGEDTPFPGQC